MTPISPTHLREFVTNTVNNTPAVDLHTHLYPPTFGDLLLWGIDRLLTYHYLIAEVFRRSTLEPEAFWDLSTEEQANQVWEHLFVRTSPISEASRGVLTCLETLGIDFTSRDLNRIRDAYKGWRVEEFLDLVFKKANVELVVMTNDPFDQRERTIWEKGPEIDPRFRAALRVDAFLLDWPGACTVLSNLGYSVSADLDGETCREVRKFLATWVERMHPLYMAVSLPPTFTFPGQGAARKLIDSCILPIGRERGLPLALMLGVRRGINPRLRLAGDGVGKAGLQAIENLCAAYPENKFMATMLSREDQHELCVTARKFSNLLPFGCWWFTNVPSIIREITAERLELLGTSFAAQHSDARVLDQLLYKWSHSRLIIAEVLVDKYVELLRTGWLLTQEDVRRDVGDLLGGNFKRLVGWRD